MTGGLWTATTGGAVALSAATAKTSLGAKAHANSGIYWKKLRVSFDGTSATATPVLVECCYITFGANAPGTNSTSVTPLLASGRSTTVGWTAAKTWSTEPTTISVIEEFYLTPAGGLYAYDHVLADEPDTALGEGLGVRLTAPATVNARLTMWIGRC